jgi:GNAT superfamily N-acetyltransferase
VALGYVRPARVSDAEEIARIQLTTWRTAFSGFIPTSVMDGLDAAWVATRWEEACASPPSPLHRVFVAVEQDESDRSRLWTVGFAAVGAGEEDDDPAAGAVTELLVEPRFARRGHGSRLLSAAVAHWQEHRLATAYAWSFTRDAASLNFYRSAGWDTDGTRRSLDMDGTPVSQLRLHTDITDSD